MYAEIIITMGVMTVVTIFVIVREVHKLVLRRQIENRIRSLAGTVRALIIEGRLWTFYAENEENLRVWRIPK